MNGRVDGLRLNAPCILAHGFGRIMRPAWSFAGMPPSAAACRSRSCSKLIQGSTLLRSAGR
ncbi:hypothetical protein B0E46_11380 [Rhodanobacter sp. B04]|nr:hypothetical protein B0E46_11380 [Rhodanobacter sp. B04]